MPEDAPVLIVAHGQPGAPEGQENAVRAMAEKVGALMPGRVVRGATLAMPGALERALLPGMLIYPLFMAGGWFTQSELPRRLCTAGAQGVHQLSPFGEDPALLDIARDLIRKTVPGPLSDIAVLLAAHGSGRSRGPALRTESFADTLRPLVRRVTCGFVEEDPRIAHAARGFDGPAVCLPFFATEADHVRHDVPEALREAGFKGDLLPPLGLAPDVPALIAAAIRAAR